MELQARQLRPTVERLEAAAAHDAGAEAARWRAALRAELAELERQIRSLADEEARLRSVASGLDLQARQLRVRRDALMAGYEAARARAEVGALLAEAHRDSAGLLQVVQEAEQRVARTRAAADALHGLAARQALEAAPSVSEELTRREEEELWGPRPEEGEGRTS